MGEQVELPRVSDSQKRGIVAGISVGLSRLSACKYANITVFDLESAMKSDIDFFRAVRRAEEEAEIFYLQRIRTAASQKDQNWRAAAWWLERSRPDRYGRTKPDAITEEQLQTFLMQVLDIIAASVQDADLSASILDKISGVLQSVRYRPE